MLPGRLRRSEAPADLAHRAIFSLPYALLSLKRLLCPLRHQTKNSEIAFAEQFLPMLAVLPFV